MSLQLIINNNSEEPIYKQIIAQVINQIASGTLSSNECLPSIRKVALECRISVITVKNAYEELERQGFIYTIAGKGCFVSNLKDYEAKDMRQITLENRIDKDLQAYRELGYQVEEIIAYLKKKIEG